MKAPGIRATRPNLPDYSERFAPDDDVMITVILFALDRLTRGGPRAIFPLFGSFENLGCKIVSVKEIFIPVDCPMRDLVVSFISWQGKYESERKSQNTIAGIERKKLTGWKPGRPVGSRDKVKRLKKRPTIYRYKNPRLNEVGK